MVGVMEALFHELVVFTTSERNQIGWQRCSDRETSEDTQIAHEDHDGVH
jgi:hypothetical protein